MSNIVDMVAAMRARESAAAARAALIEVGTAFADQLHELAKARDPNARHLGTLPTIGVTRFHDLPVVVVEDMPPGLARLVDADGKVLRSYMLKPLLTRDTRTAYRMSHTTATPATTRSHLP